MSKKFKDKPCVYCPTGISATADHAFAREFFLERHRANLPKVPACAVCNGEKSALEHYLTTILSFGGVHPNALENLITTAPRRLAKNLKLRDTLAAAINAPDAEHLPSSGLDECKITAVLFKFVSLLFVQPFLFFWPSPFSLCERKPSSKLPLKPVGPSPRRWPRAGAFAESRVGAVLLDTELL